MKTYSINKLGRQFGLSRSTLLYYDSIGLLSPSIRSEKNYRIYTESDRERLQHICIYRDMGLPLKEIQMLLSVSEKSFIRILENHLSVLSDRIHTIRKQQHTIVNLLKEKRLTEHSGVMDKQTWISILKASGMDEKDMDKWHEEFEKQSPQSHHDFLVSLGLEDEEIAVIRKKQSK